jgi:hypothetical protein
MTIAVSLTEKELQRVESIINSLQPDPQCGLPEQVIGSRSEKFSG